MHPRPHGQPTALMHRGYAQLHHHTVHVQRVVGDRGVSVPAGSEVGPNETIRLIATGISYSAIHAPDFAIYDEDGSEVWRQRNVGVSGGGLGMTAWVDLAAPVEVGEYRVVVHAQSFPWLPQTHITETTFRVSRTPPDKPDKPIEGGIWGGVEDVFGGLKTMGWLALGVVALLAVREVAKR